MPDFIDTTNPDYIAGRNHFKVGGTMREAFNRAESNPDGDTAFMLGFADGFLDVFRSISNSRAFPR